MSATDLVEWIAGRLAGRLGASYLANPAFLTKLAFLVLGTLNALSVRMSLGWSAAIAGGTIALRLRVQALASFTLWVGALLAGRWIGFVG